MEEVIRYRSSSEGKEVVILGQTTLIAHFWQEASKLDGGLRQKKGILEVGYRAID